MAYTFKTKTGTFGSGHVAQAHPKICWHFEKSIGWTLFVEGMLLLALLITKLHVFRITFHLPVFFFSVNQAWSCLCWF